MVGVLEQVVGLKDIVGLHPVLGDGLDEVADVLQLEGSRWPSGVGGGAGGHGRGWVEVGGATGGSGRGLRARELRDKRVERVWAHLMPVLSGLIYFLHGAWLELIDEPTRRRGGG